MYQEWLKDFKKLKEKKECLCEKSYEKINIYYAMSLNKSKGTLQIFEHKDGNFGKLITEIPINYCPMCGRKLKEGD